MLLKFFYLHSLFEIQQRFPKLKDPANQRYTTSYCGILHGWAPPMADTLNKIYPIEKEMNDCLFLEGSMFYFDKRLGDILFVDTDIKDNCFFLNKINDRYEISTHYTANTIGGITNRSLPPEHKRKNRLYTIIGQNKKGVSIHGNMAFSD